MIDLTETPQGLLITLTDREEFTDKYGEDNPYPDLHELLDDSRHIGNGWNDGTENTAGYLTNSPIILEGATPPEIGLSGTFLPYTEYETAYWFPNYMLENPFKTLLKKGQVTFTKA